MATPSADSIASIVSLRRYPVKSMQGEELNATLVTERGLLGDRRYALVDPRDGKIGSAKNPRKWPGLFDFQARYVEEPGGAAAPIVQITLPDGTRVTDTQSSLNEALSRAVGRPVMLHAAPPERPTLEEYWPNLEGLPHRDAVTDESMPVGSFFDLAPVHLLTTATLNRLRELYPQGRFEARRFRPNLVIAPADGSAAFLENAWVGRTLRLGAEVRLKVTGPCPRCVMTTLEQADLPRDLGILRTAVQHNQGHVGVYATVVQGGTVRRGDSVSLE
jgi:uncharacterized protein YcbX